MTEEEKVHLYVINKSQLPEKEIAEIENKINSENFFKDFVETVKNINKDISAFDYSILMWIKLLQRSLIRI